MRRKVSRQEKENTSVEEGQSSRLAVERTWADRSMLQHVSTYILLMFAAFSVVFIGLLYDAATVYEANVDSALR
jgi:hypothetical protein